MRKILIGALILILLIGFVTMAVVGISIFNFEIAPIKLVIERNENLDERIAELEKKKNTEYKTAISSLDTSYANLKSAKQKYQDQITYSTEEEIQKANQTEKYKLDFLWTNIGLHATDNNIIMQANVSAGSITGSYNIAITAVGEYIDISEFIYSIENDSKLGFRIEDFSIKDYSEQKLQATFVMRNIPIDEQSLNSATPLYSGSVGGSMQGTQTMTDSSTVPEQ